MAVLYYQLVILGTIVGVGLLRGQRASLYVAFGWTAWTLLMVNTSRLTVFQLLTVWGSYLVAGLFIAQRSAIGEKSAVIDEQSARIRELETALVGYTPETRDAVLDAFRSGEMAEISGPEHLAALHDALSTARESVCFLSGWVRSGIVSEQFAEDLREALRRGVNIYVGHGWADSRGRFKEDPGVREARVLLERIQRQSKEEDWPGQLHLARLGTHEKLLVKDAEYFIFGSNNWLSNSTFVNDERSFRIVSRGRAAYERDRVIEKVRAGR